MEAALFNLDQIKTQLSKLTGGKSQTVLSSSSTLAIPAYAIQFQEDSTVTFTNDSGTDVTNAVYPKGQTIFGSFSSITWVSGRFTVYSL